MEDDQENNFTCGAHTPCSAGEKEKGEGRSSSDVGAAPRDSLASATPPPAAIFFPKGTTPHLLLKFMADLRGREQSDFPGYLQTGSLLPIPRLVDDSYPALFLSLGSAPSAGTMGWKALLGPLLGKCLSGPMSTLACRVPGTTTILDF